jgi:hypothetical protein
VETNSNKEAKDKVVGDTKRVGEMRFDYGNGCAYTLRSRSIAPRSVGRVLMHCSKVRLLITAGHAAGVGPG